MIGAKNQLESVSTKPGVGRGMLAHRSQGGDLDRESVEAKKGDY